MGPAARDCPVVPATRRTGENALGHPHDSGVRDLSYRLAIAVSDFHFSFEVGGRKEALVAIHRIMLELRGQMGGKTYHQHLADGDVAPETWRPEALALAQALRFSPERFATAEAWHDEAHRLARAEQAADL
jgi:ATP-dependent DNA helicase UvrD/PcrA